MKTYLDVKYADKDKVKAMGARFDMSSRKWFVPDGLDLTPFLRWLPSAPKLSKAIKKILRT